MRQKLLANSPLPLSRAGPLLRGFSLVELTIVIVLIGIVSAIAIPKYGNSLARYRVEAAAKRLRADLLLAREGAKHQSQTLAITFYAGSRSAYSTNGLRDLDRRTIQKYNVDLSEEPYHATITSISAGGDDVLQFDGFGVPDSAATIGLRVGAYTQTVVVEADTGEVLVKTP